MYEFMSGKSIFNGVPVVSLQYNHSPLQPAGDITKSRSLDRKHVEPIVLTKWRHSAYFQDPNDKVRNPNDKNLPPRKNLHRKVNVSIITFTSRLCFMICIFTCGKMLHESRVSVVDWFALQRLIKTRRFRAASARLHPYKHQVSSLPDRPVGSPVPESEQTISLHVTNYTTLLFAPS